MAYFDEVIADTPLAYWRLNEPSGATAADSSGNGHTATFTGTYTRNTPGLLVTDPDPGTSVAGAGYATVPYDSAFNVNYITIEGIINVSGATTGNVIDRDPESTTRIFQLQTGSYGLNFIWWSAAGAGPYNIIAPAGGRSHFAFTLDNTGAKAYVNGVLVATVSQTGGLRTGAEPILIGAHRNGIFNQKFVGELDEIAIYNYALDATRIATHSLAVGSGLTEAQVESMYTDVLYEALPAVQIEAMYTDVLFGGIPAAQIEHMYIDVLTSVAAKVYFKGWGVPLGQ